jgi:hypothetical protein
LGLADLARAAVDYADSLAGVVDEQLFARRVGLAHRQRQALPPTTVVLAERAVLEAVGLLGLVLLPQQFERDAFAAQLLVHVRPRWRGTLHRRWITGREQAPFKNRVVNFRRQGVGQAC